MLYAQYIAFLITKLLTKKNHFTMKTKSILFPALILLLSFGTLTSCDNNTTAEEKMEDAADDLDDAGEDIADAFRTESQELKADLKEMRSDINERIKKLNDNMAGASAEAKEEMSEEVKQLEAWGEDIDARMNKIGNSISDGWQEFKADTRNTLDKIDQQMAEMME